MSFRTRLQRNNPRAETRCLETRSPTAHSGIETGADTWTRFRIRCLLDFQPRPDEPMPAINPFLCKLNIKSVYPTLPITAGAGTI
jgi:hypothetical protein